ncbi:MAG: hypothetical protein GXO43_00365 [Crenarchaeota archaeon]|nr:hypothetical protein [Thermoproteota archaeon]
MPGIPRDLCLRCKGYRNLCGLGYCPLLRSFRGKVKVITSISDTRVNGATPPSALVGEHGYPYINVYIGLPPSVHGDEAKKYDDPSMWFLRLGLGDIIELRSQLVYAKKKSKADNPWRLYEEEIGLAALSRRPVDAEAELSSIPRPRLRLDPLLPPIGPSITARKIRVSGNPSLHPVLEKTIWDDLRAEQAVWRLHKAGLDHYEIVRALSLGFIGTLKRRRLVPTRWSITAVDSILAKMYLKKIHLSRPISNILVYHAEYLYNKYTIILAPGRYTSTWIEVWMPNSLWNPHAEPSILIIKDDYWGRPEKMDGGFLAARTPILEHLARINRQAKVVILREVLPQYVYPVGNWQIRMTVGEALRRGPVLKNPMRNELLLYLRKTHSLPDHIYDYVCRKIYGERQLTLDDFRKQQ